MDVATDGGKVVNISRLPSWRRICKMDMGSTMVEDVWIVERRRLVRENGWLNIFQGYDCSS